MTPDTQSKLSALGILVSALIVGELLFNLLRFAPVPAVSPDPRDAPPVAATASASR